MNEQDRPARVVITDIDISFGSLVLLMIKVAFAAIPASIILSIIVFVVAFIFSACGLALGGLGGY